MKRIASTVAMVIFLAWPSSSFAAGASPLRSPFADASFDITLPSGAATTKHNGPDFVVYDVKWSDTGKLGLYEGWYPETLLTGDRVEKSDLTMNGLVVNQSVLRNGDLTSKELYIHVAGGLDRFVVHAWYSGLAKSDAGIADQILATIKAKDPLKVP